MNPKRDQHLCFAAYKERDKGSDRPKQTSTPHLRTAVCLVPTVLITHYYPSTPSLKLLCGKTQNCYHQPVLQPCITKTSIALWQALIKIQNSTLDIPYLCNELCKTSTQNSILRSCLSSQWLSPLKSKNLIFHQILTAVLLMSHWGSVLPHISASFLKERSLSPHQKTDFAHGTPSFDGTIHPQNYSSATPHFLSDNYNLTNYCTAGKMYSSAAKAAV